jgi:hypothetical protein
MAETGKLWLSHVHEVHASKISSFQAFFFGTPVPGTFVKARAALGHRITTKVKVAPEHANVPLSFTNMYRICLVLFV